MDRRTLADLIEERLPRAAVHAIQSGPKDAHRFADYVAILQQRVSWSDPIVLPFGEHLYVVAKPGPAYVVKCDCGHEFGDHRDNWKLHALISVRDSEDALREIYPDKMHGDPRWNHLREYFCPGCSTLLDVEAVPPGYPVVHDFVPDLQVFYEQWLERELPTAPA